MKLSSLNKFFNRQISIEQFKADIESEVNSYKFLLSKRGSSLPVYLDEDISMFFGKDEIVFLNKLFLEDKLSEYQIYYILDAILMSDNIVFENESIMDIAETMTDPAVNGQLTKETAKDILKFILS